MSATALEVRQHDSRGGRSWSIGIALLVALGVWYVNTPSALPTSNATVNASAVTGQPVYLGVFAATDEFERTCTCPA